MFVHFINIKFIAPSLYSALPADCTGIKAATQYYSRQAGQPAAMMIILIAACIALLSVALNKPLFIPIQFIQFESGWFRVNQTTIAYYLHIIVYFIRKSGPSLWNVV